MHPCCLTIVHRRTYIIRIHRHSINKPGHVTCRMPADNTASPLMMLNFVKLQTHYSMEDPGPSSAYYRRFAATADGPIRPPSGSREPLLEPSQSTAEFIDSASDGSLYSLLNVSRDASTAEIKERYRSLAGIYHPDKQPDDTRRQAAHERFQAIQRAHEVLTDPQRRAVYDMFGEEGLRTNWELGPRNMSSGEIKSHFAKQAENKRRMDAEALVNSQVGQSFGQADARVTCQLSSMLAQCSSLAGDSRIPRQCHIHL